MFERMSGIFLTLVIVLLLVSAGAYVVGLFILFTRRRLPEDVVPPRFAAFSALVLCATKSIVGGTPLAFIQPVLPGLIVLATAYAVWKMLEVVIQSLNTDPATRVLIQRWSAILIPPVASIGLLGVFDTVPDEDRRLIIYAFIAVNSVPAIFVLASARSLLGLRRG